MFSRRAVLSASALSRLLSVDATAVTYKRFGNPASVLSVESVKVDDALAPNGVLVKVLAAPISAFDLSQVRGFGSGSVGVAGNEGVGVVQKVGSAVTGLAVSDLVVPIKSGLGTWATATVAPADALAKIPGTADKFPISAAYLGSPATAIAIVDSGAVKAGDVIVQNNAGSAVGQAVVAYAASKGIKTINIVSPKDDFAAVSKQLTALGATSVVSEKDAASHGFESTVAAIGTPKLGISSAGGEAGNSVATSLGAGGTFVVYGNSTRQPYSLSLDTLVAKGVKVQGFSLDAYLSSAPAPAVAALISTALQVAPKLTLAVKPFADFSSALAQSVAANDTKIVLTMA